MNPKQMRLCICVGILLSFAIPALTAMPCADDDTCDVTPEKELLQSTGHVRVKMVEAEEGNSGNTEANIKTFFIYPTVDLSKCFDIPANDATNGKQLQIWDCNWSPAQHFQYNPSDSTIRPTNHNNKCLDGTIPKEGPAEVGNKVILWDCWGGDTQKWEMVVDRKAVGDVYIKAKNWDLCVGDAKETYDKSNLLTLQKCTHETVQNLPAFYPGFSIKSKTANCIDIPAAEIKNGAKMQIWTCNDSPAQLWYYDKRDGSIRPTANLKYCLDAGKSLKQGEALLLWECNQGDWQKWKFPTEGSHLFEGLANLKLEKHDLCAADATKKYSKSSPLTMEKCSNENLLAAPGLLGTDINPLAADSICLDVDGNKIEKGQKIIAYKCHAKMGDVPVDNQNFFVNTSDDSIRSTAQPNLCFDVVDGKMEKNQGVQLWDCNNGKNQQFVMEANEIQARGTDLCVADPKHEYASGANMALTKCTAAESKAKIASFRVKGLANMKSTWSEPNDFKKPQCADGEIAWNCNEVGHGPRISCPKAWPYMCNDPNQCSGDTASEKKDRCCSRSIEECKNGGGLRPM